jgi:putative hydrolase of the HAD superfamily
MYEFMCSLLDIEKAKRAAITQSVHRRYFTAESWRAFDDVVPTLEELKNRGMRMGLISNWDSSLEGIIHAMGFSKYFDVILSSAVVQLCKPMPEIFALALKTMGARAEQTMHVGDHVSADIEGAYKAGLTPVLITRRAQAAVMQDLPPTTLIISKLTELLNHVA